MNLYTQTTIKKSKIFTINNVSKQKSSYNKRTVECINLKVKKIDRCNRTSEFEKMRYIRI